MEIQFKVSKLFSAFFSKQLLVTEIANCRDESNYSSTVASVLSVLQFDSERLKTPFKLHATEFVLQAIDYLIENEHSCNLTKNLVYSVISKFVSREELNILDIQAKINNYPVPISPLVIVELDKIGAVSFINFFQACAECPQKTTVLVEFLFSLACNSFEEHDSAQFHYLFTAIVQIGFGELASDVQKSMSGQTVKGAVLLVNSLTRKFWDFMLKFPEKEIHAFGIQNKSGHRCIYFHMLSFQKCYLEQLVYLISYKPEVRASTALNSQHEWTYLKSPKNLVSFITQLLVPLEVEKVIDKVEDIINRYEINWKTLLLVVSAIQVCYPKGNRSLKVLINSLVHQALDTSQKELLLASFLLARQINAENTSSPQYGAWFSSITSSSTTSKHFAFLLKFLTNSVRHEPAWVLLAHKNNPPSIPVMDNCRALWMDYAALVRTRLEDLKLKNPQEQVVEEDITLVKEVDSAIAAYEKSGKIPSSVIEAAIFRKPYFLNKFLPILLKPRRIPNPPDVREEFVDELKKTGKLPMAHYETYCAASHLLEEQDSVIENMEQQPIVGKTSYQNLMAQIASCKDGQQCWFLIERFDVLLASLLPPSETGKVIIFSSDVKKTIAKNEVAWKIAECWVESLRVNFTNDQPEWFNRYFLILCRYPPLIESLYGLLWLFTHKCSEDDETIRCYAVVMCLLCVNEHLLSPVHQGTFQGDFLQLLMSENHLVISGSEWMLFYLRLLFHTVFELKRRNELGRSRLMSSVYVWLARRVSSSRRIRDYHKFLALGTDGQVLQEATLSLRDWLRLEMAVEADKDVLSWSERSGYLHSVLKIEFQELPVHEISTGILDSIVRRLSNGPTGLADCSRDLLLLLQSVLSHPHADSSNNIAWLTTYWQKLRLEQGSSADTLLWSLVCCLPPYLLNRNTLDQTITESSLKTLTNLIENDWRNTLTSGSAFFSKSITSHILLALEGLQPVPIIPCLQFAAQIHGLEDGKNRSSSWKSLNQALRIFHPLKYDLAVEKIQWSGEIEVDLLVNQLMAIVATVLCVEDNIHESVFILEIGHCVSQNCDLLKGWKMSSWFGNDSLLPWNKILPTYLFNLLPYVLLKTLVSWSDMLLRNDLPTAVDFLEALVSVNNQWIKTTDSFIDCQTGQRGANYPAGMILDVVSQGRLSNAVKKILNEVPTRALRMFQQTPCYQMMESDFQALVKQRCS